MTDVELEIVNSLDRVFPVPDVVSDWDGVLDRVGGQQGARTVPPRTWRTLGAATAIVVCGLLVAPAFGLGDRLLSLIRAESPLRETQTPVWSHDGRRIAFVSTRDGNPEIYVMDKDGSEQRNLTRYPLRDGSPAWSPDGRRIVFERWVPPGPDVFVMNADGTGQRNLTHDQASDIRPVWSPDGRRIAFVRGVRFTGPRRVGGPPGRYVSFRNYLYVVNADGSGMRKLTEDPVYGHGSVLTPVWSADGRTIRFWRWVVNADGTGVRRIPRAVPFAGALSPDGRKIALAVACHEPRCFAQHGNLYLMNADGSGRRILARNVAWSTPVWSPDGRRIAFRSLRHGNPEVYVINADGSGLRRVTHHPANERWFSWSPDGTTIAFVRNREVHVANTDGSGDEQLTRIAS